MANHRRRTSEEYGSSRLGPFVSLRAYLAGPPAVSQRRLARLARCNQSHISMIASGDRVPSAKLALRLHEITGVPLPALLRPRKRRRAKSEPKSEMHMHV
jgi:helix-turn-helix protein